MKILDNILIYTQKTLWKKARCVGGFKDNLKIYDGHVAYKRFLSWGDLPKASWYIRIMAKINNWLVLRKIKE
jgi:hypothetical protein